MSRNQSLIFLVLSFSLFFTSTKLYTHDKTISFLYIDANSGQSSGGHTALKIGDYVYHFQYYPDKIFHIVRESWFDFRFSYNIQENRTIVVSDFKLENSDLKKIETGFDKLFLIQEKHFENLKFLQADLDIIDKFKLGKINTYPIEGIGYFSKEINHSPNHLIHAIRLEVQDFDPSKEKNKLLNNIKNLKYEPNKIDSRKLVPYIYPTLPDFYSETYTDLIQKYVFYDTIENNLKLKSLETFKLHSDFINPITDTERILLENLQKHLETKLIEQMTQEDTNSHWGLLGCQILVFYLSLEETLNSGYFHFPDTFPSNSEKILWNKTKNLSKLSDETLLIFNRYRSEYFDSNKTLTIEQYIDLVDAGNRYHEIQAAIRYDRPIRNFPIKTMPNKKGIYHRLPNFYLSNDDLKLKTEQSSDAYVNYLQSLQNIYPYHLLFQNCTSEIFRSIDGFYNYDPNQIKKALGKQINPSESFSFVPFYANYEVQKNYPIESIKTILSYRRQRMKDLRNHESSFKVFLRESITPTSTIYEFNDEDEWFLTFTDENVILRPFFGFVNFTAGLSQLLIGIPLATEDNGHTFKKGWNGIFFSMPELAFFNIRKGTFYNITTMDLDSEFPNEKIKDSN